MKCENCGAPAKIYTVSDGKREKTVRLCPACYKRLYGMRRSLSGNGTKTCPACGTTLQEFQGSFLLGCADCYKAFRNELIPIIRDLQGTTQHVGKAPSAAAAENYDRIRTLINEQERLKAEIEIAVRENREADVTVLLNRLRRNKRELQER